MPRDICECGKRRFRDVTAARVVLAELQRKDNAAHEKMQARAYRCEHGGWHLTSWSRRRFRNKTGRRPT